MCIISNVFVICRFFYYYYNYFVVIGGKTSIITFWHIIIEVIREQKLDFCTSSRVSFQAFKNLACDGRLQGVSVPIGCTTNEEAVAPPCFSLQNSESMAENCAAKVATPASNICLHRKLKMEDRSKLLV